MSEISPIRPSGCSLASCGARATCVHILGLTSRQTPLGIWSGPRCVCSVIQWQAAHQHGHAVDPRWEQIDFENRTVRLRRPKNGTLRTREHLTASIRRSTSSRVVRTPRHQNQVQKREGLSVADSVARSFLRMNFFQLGEVVSLVFSIFSTWRSRTRRKRPARTRGFRRRLFS
jgi:hypothetical protein